MTSPASHPLTATAAALNVTCSFDHDGVAFSIYGSTPGEVIAGIREIRGAPLTGAASTPKAEAPGKPSAATTAPSPRTAEAAPSPSAQPAAAPAPSPEATPPAAAAASATVAYADLQKAVLTLHKRNPTAAVPIAKSLGADTFKLLPETKWAEALRLVTEAIAAEDARG